MDVVMRLRGGNSATITDVVDLRDYVARRFKHLETRIKRLKEEECHLAPMPAESESDGAAVCPMVQEVDEECQRVVLGQITRLSEGQSELRVEMKDLQTTMR